jgi:hypothetical protein
MDRWPHAGPWLLGRLIDGRELVGRWSQAGTCMLDWQHRFIVNIAATVRTAGVIDVRYWHPPTRMPMYWVERLVPQCCLNSPPM